MKFKTLCTSLTAFDTSHKKSKKQQQQVVVLTSVDFLEDPNFSWDRVNVAKCNPLVCNKCGSNHSLLHSILKYDPPSQVIETALKKSTSVLYEADCEGRLPIHIAVMHKADHSVVRTLIKFAKEGSKRMCSHQDSVHGKIPLHMAIESYDPQFYDLNQELVIQELFYAVPESVLIEDNDGNIPLEVAFLMDCNKTLLYKLQQLLRPPFARNKSSLIDNKFSRAA